MYVVASARTIPIVHIGLGIFHGKYLFLIEPKFLIPCRTFAYFPKATKNVQLAQSHVVLGSPYNLIDLVTFDIPQSSLPRTKY